MLIPSPPQFYNKFGSQAPLLRLANLITDLVDGLLSLQISLDTSPQPGTGRVKRHATQQYHSCDLKTIGEAVI